MKSYWENTNWASTTVLRAASWNINAWHRMFFSLKPTRLTEVDEEPAVALPLILRHGHDAGNVVLLLTVLFLRSHKTLQRFSIQHTRREARFKAPRGKHPDCDSRVTVKNWLLAIKLILEWKHVWNRKLGRVLQLGTTPQSRSEMLTPPQLGLPLKSSRQNDILSNRSWSGSRRKKVPRRSTGSCDQGIVLPGGKGFDSISAA